MAAQWTVHESSSPELVGGLAEQYAEALVAGGQSDRVALLVPTQAAAEQARRLVLQAGVPALLDARIMTFPQLAELILVANRRDVRQITPLQRELLLADVLAQLAAEGKLGYLAPTADRPGTIAAVAAVLDEIKRGGISSQDFLRLAEEQAPADKTNAPLAAIFSQYQDRLHSLGLYDEPGLFWHALEALQDDQRKPLEELRVLYLDGFQEFTTTQLQMLQALGEKLERIELRLWVDPAREQMTARSAATLRQLRATGLVGSSASGQPPTGPPADGGDALSRLRAALFSSQEAGLTTTDSSLQIIEVAGGVMGECREIARRLKLLLKDTAGLRPDGVAIFLRSWDSGYDSALRQMLQWYGVPADFAQGPALAAVPVVRAALAAFEVATGGWLRRDVIKLLSSNYVRPLLDEGPRLSPRRLEQLAIEAGVIGGELESGGHLVWLRGLQRLRTRLEAERSGRQALEQAGGMSDRERGRVQEDEEGNRFRPLELLERLLVHVEQAEKLISRLRELLLPLEQADSLPAAVVALEQALEALAVPDRAGGGSAERVALDLQALQAFSLLLREMSESPEVLQLGRSGEVEQFVARLRQVCAATRLPGTARRRAGVQVLDLAQAPLERFAVVVVPGLSDGAFPLRRRPDPLYSEAARQRLQRALPGLQPRLGTQHDEEHLLYSALLAAEQQVWLTYPFTEPGGKPLLRSLYLDEVVRQWRAETPRQREALLVQRRGQSQVIASLAEAGHYLEVLEATEAGRATAAASVLETISALTAPPGSPTPEHVRTAARREKQRESSREATTFSGLLSDARITQQLAEHFGANHRYSVSQLRMYTGCPMQFLFARVLGLEAPLEPDEGADPRDVGLLVHSILADFGRRSLAAGAPVLNEDNVEAACELLGACVEHAREEMSEAWPGASGVWEQTVNRIRGDLTALLQYEACSKDAPGRLCAVEHSFGRDGTVTLDSAPGGAVLLHGRIDRIDTVEVDGEPRWRIWDYKTGNGPGATLVKLGLDMQLAVYALALAQAPPDNGLGSDMWGYCRVARPVGYKTRLKRGEPEKDPLQEATDRARERITQAVTGIREGRFPVQPTPQLAPCRYCDFGGICRVERKCK